MENKILILSTQLIHQQWIDEAGLEGIEMDCIPFIKTISRADKELRDSIAGFAKKEITAVFTSKNAIAAISENLQSKPNWKIACISGETKQVAIEIFGKENIIYTGKDAAALAAEIIESRLSTPLVFFAGNKRRDTLPAALTTAGIEWQELMVYETEEIPTIIDKNYDAVLFWSPSGVNSFFSVNTIAASTVLFAIGNTTATAIKQFSSAKIIIASEHSVQQLVQAAIQYFKK